MQKQHIVTINGRQYDGLTGLLINEATQTTATQTVAAPTRTTAPITHGAAVHSPLQQRSQTLRRRATAKPITQKAPAVAPAPSIATRPPAASSTSPQQNIVRRSPSISRFAPHPVPQQKAPLRTRRMSDIAPLAHPATIKAHEAQTQKVVESVAPRAPKPAVHIKEDAIEHALATAVTNHKDHKRSKKRASGWTSIAASSLAILMLGGYFTYLNMPNLSVRVAAAQAGFDASYPEYKPDGYRLNGPIAAENGKVTMKFASNSGPQNFSIKQEQSTWDSMAVQEYVDTASENNAITTTVDGLTIYIYGSDAAWVNGGVLYTLDGDAPLSGEQIRRIATSM